MSKEELEKELVRAKRKITMLVMRLKKYGDDPVQVMKEIEKKI